MDKNHGLHNCKESPSGPVDIVVNELFVFISLSELAMISFSRIRCGSDLSISRSSDFFSLRFKCFRICFGLHVSVSGLSKYVLVSMCLFPVCKSLLWCPFFCLWFDKICFGLHVSVSGLSNLFWF